MTAVVNYKKNLNPRSALSACKLITQLLVSKFFLIEMIHDVIIKNSLPNQEQIIDVEKNYCLIGSYQNSDKFFVDFTRF